MLTIIGCGNANRSDDGLGSYVAQALTLRLDKQGLEGKGNNQVRVFDGGTAGMDVMFQARGSDALIIVDANQSDSEAGSIFEVPGSELENVPDPGYNLHDFRWDNALYAGKKIFKDDFPDDVLVYLIEAENLDLGIGLSTVVRASADRVVDKIMRRIREYSA